MPSSCVYVPNIVYSFKDDNDHLAVMTHIVAQDVLWLHDAALDIVATVIRAYFVQIGSRTDAFYVITKTDEAFRKKHDAAWRRLTRDESFRVRFFPSMGAKEHVAEW